MMSVNRIRRLSVRPPNQPAMRADRDADEQDDDLDDERDADADARPVEQPAEQVAAKLVRPEDVARRAWRQRPVATREDGLQVLLLNTGTARGTGPKIPTKMSAMTRTRPTIASRFLRSRPHASRHRPVGWSGHGLVAACDARGLRRHGRAPVLAVPDPGVDVRVQHIDHDVEERDRERVDQDRHRHEQAVVARC